MKRNIYLILIFLACLGTTLTGQAADPFCYDNGDIRYIRAVAAESILQAHQQGGKLFRNSFVFTPSDAAFETTRFKTSYSEFADVFRFLMSYSQPEGLPALHLGYSKVSNLFLVLYNKHIDKPFSFEMRYQRGKIYFDQGLYEDCLVDVGSIIESEIWDSPTIDKDKEKEILLMEGTAQSESMQYDNAIATLSELIKKYPNHKEALFHRASVYFEKGDFDSALSDYLASEISKDMVKIKSKVSNEFSTALKNGLLEGSGKAVIELVPTLCQSAYGCGKCLWHFAQEPVSSTTNFYNACYEAGAAVSEYLKTVDREKIEEIAQEVQQLYSDFDRLTDAEKGQAIGYCIGKYGVDLFIGGATLKCVGAVKNLKNANRIANLEALASSEKTREAVKKAALAHAAEREAFFKHAKIHWDKQNKHVPGKHNYMKNRSIFEHPDAQGLLNKYAGKGTPLKNRILGRPDYRERLNFGEFIGYHVDENTLLKTATTWGEIRYSKTGAHIIPILPK